MGADEYLLDDLDIIDEFVDTQEYKIERPQKMESPKKKNKKKIKPKKVWQKKEKQVDVKTIEMKKEDIVLNDDQQNGTKQDELIPTERDEQQTEQSNDESIIEKDMHMNENVKAKQDVISLLNIITKRKPQKNKNKNKIKKKIIKQPNKVQNMQ